MAKVNALAVMPSWNARRYVFALESETAKTWELELPARIATALYYPAMLVLTNAIVEVFVLPASLLVCCTNPIELPGGRFEREKFAEVPTPATDAVTLYGPPAVLLAVKIAARATPCALVVAVFTPLANVPLAPLVGAVKVTVTPFTGLFDASLTVACSCVANSVLRVALWAVPAVPVVLAGAPAGAA